MKIKQIFCKHEWVYSNWFKISSYHTRYTRKCTKCGKIEIKG